MKALGLVLALWLVLGAGAAHADPADNVLYPAKVEDGVTAAEADEAREARWAEYRKRQAAEAARKATSAAAAQAAAERAKPPPPAPVVTPCQAAKDAAIAYKLARKTAAETKAAAIRAERHAMDRARVLARLGHISIADAREDLISVDYQSATAAYDTYEAAKRAALAADTARNDAASTARACKVSK